MLKKKELEKFKVEIAKARLANKSTAVILPSTEAFNDFTYYVADGLHRLEGAKLNIEKKTVDGTEYILRNGNQVPIQVWGKCTL